MIKTRRKAGWCLILALMAALAAYGRRAGKNATQIVWYRGNMWAPVRSVDTPSQAETHD